MVSTSHYWKTVLLLILFTTVLLSLHIGWHQVVVLADLDETDPIISDMTPANETTVTDQKPTISASLSDHDSGIDVTSISLIVNYIDVTNSATIHEFISSTTVSFTPTADLPIGTVTVIIEVSDNSGNTASETWQFTITTPSPTGDIPGFPLEGVAFGVIAAIIATYIHRRNIIPKM